MLCPIGSSFFREENNVLSAYVLVPVTMISVDNIAVLGLVCAAVFGLFDFVNIFAVQSAFLHCTYLFRCMSMYQQSRAYLPLLCASYTYFCPLNYQGRNEGDKGGTIPRAPSHCGGAKKS